MILKKGSFFSDCSVTGVVTYFIDKKLTQKNVYKINFEYISSIDDYWRRETTSRYEIKMSICSFELNENNSSQSMDDINKFEKFLEKNISEYFNEINIKPNLKTNLIYWAKEIKDIIYIKRIKDDFNERQIFDDVKIIEVIQKRIKKAY